MPEVRAGHGPALQQGDPGAVLGLSSVPAVHEDAPVPRHGGVVRGSVDATVALLSLDWTENAVVPKAIRRQAEQGSSNHKAFYYDKQFAEIPQGILEKGLLLDAMDQDLTNEAVVRAISGKLGPEVILFVTVPANYLSLVFNGSLRTSSWRRARAHMRKACALCRQQREAGGVFVLVVPAHDERCEFTDIRDLVQLESVVHLVPDMGISRFREWQGRYCWRPCGVVTNSFAIAEVLCQRCNPLRRPAENKADKGGAAQFIYEVVRTLLDKAYTAKLVVSTECFNMDKPRRPWFPQWSSAVSHEARNFAERIFGQFMAAAVDEHGMLDYENGSAGCNFPVGFPVDSIPEDQEDGDGDAISPEAALDETEEDLDDNMEAPTPLQQRLILQVHTNLGHPETRDFLRVLKAGKVRQSVLQWVRTSFKCLACAQRQWPKARHPASATRCLRFNEVLGADIFEVAGIPGVSEKIMVLSMVDWGTGFQVAARLPRSRSAEEVYHTFATAWVRNFGPPAILVTDQGGEFVSVFTQRVTQGGTTHHHVAAHSPWLNSKTERHGGHLKAVLARARATEVISSLLDFDCLLAEACAAKNNFTSRSGFSPHQRVFGSAVRLPRSLLSDDYISPDLLRSGDDDEVRRATAMRMAAQRALIETQDGDIFRRAAAARPRKDLPMLRKGDIVFVWRSNKANTLHSGVWVGPGTVVIAEDDNRTVYVALHGVLLKASRMQVRLAENEERRGAEEINRLLADLVVPTRAVHVQRGFRDVTDEGEPPEEGSGDQAGAGSGLQQPAAGALPGDLLPPPAAGALPGALLRDPADGALSGDLLPVPAVGDLPGIAQGRSGRLALPRHPPPQAVAAGRHRTTARLDDVAQPEPEASAAGSSAAGSSVHLRHHSEEPPMTRRRVSEPGDRRQDLATASVAANNVLDGHILRPRPVPDDVARERSPRRTTSDRAASSSSRTPAGSAAPWPTPYYLLEFGQFFNNQYTSRDEAQNALPDQPEVLWNYLHHNDVNHKGVRWHGACASEGDSFSLSEAEAVYCQNNFYLANATRNDELHPSKIEKHDWPLFEAAIAKEWSSILATDAVTVLKGKDAQAVRENNPQRIITSRLVLRWKPTDEGPKAKARWCVRGFQDPDVHLIERSAPTPSLTTLQTFFQVAASLQFEAEVGDVSTAFMQGSPAKRDKPLYAAPPDGITLPGVGPDDVIRLDKEVYGLMSGMSAWRATVVKFLVGELGYKKNHLDGCAFSLFTGGDKIVKGMIVVEVDDFLSCGDSEHASRIQSLRQRFRFGHWHNLYTQGPRSFAGRLVEQDKNYGFKLSMAGYIKDKLSVINLPRGRSGNKTDKCTPSEVAQLRAVNGGIGWVARQARPDEAASASILQSSLKGPLVSDIVTANAVVKRLKSTSDVGIRVVHIPIEKVRIVAVSDASFMTDKNSNESQAGYVVAFTDPTLNAGGKAPMSIVAWSSHKTKRVVSSTLAAETLALSEALAEAEWVHHLWTSSVFYDYDIGSGFRDGISIVGDDTVAVMSSDVPTFNDPSVIAVVDAKSVYDNVSKEGSIATCRRTAIEVAIVRQALQRLRGRIRWIPHDCMVSDALTKVNGNAAPLQRMMREATWHIVDEVVNLAERKSVKDEGGYISRPHRRMCNDDE